jgi:NAD(P)-dependent dehydrogenase (short-subunit alcohol dehydrogenase family)
MASTDEYPRQFPSGQQQEEMAAVQAKMEPQPFDTAPWYKGSGKLEGKIALITGADSGIGRSVAVLYAREGANIVVNYLKTDEDALTTQQLVQREGRQCLLLRGDVGQRSVCNELVANTVKQFGRLDVLVLNAAVQRKRDSITDITEEQLLETFRTNIFSNFFLSQAALPHLRQSKGNIICTTSVNMFKGHGSLIDYTSTKGAQGAFVRSLALSLAKEGIRVNGVAPGPIYTPLISGSFDDEHIKKFGQQTAMGRAGQPEEVAPAFVFLASRDASYFTGQILHPNGGMIVNA